MLTFLLIWLIPSTILLLLSYIRDVSRGYEIDITIEGMIINAIFVAGGLFTVLMCAIFGVLKLISKLNLPPIPNNWSEVRYTFNKQKNK